MYNLSVTFCRLSGEVCVDDNDSSSSDDICSGLSFSFSFKSIKLDFLFRSFCTTTSLTFFEGMGFCFDASFVGLRK